MLSLVFIKRVPIYAKSAPICIAEAISLPELIHPDSKIVFLKKDLISATNGIGLIVPACPPAPCNNNGICERGESCNCPDCDGYQDSCANGLVCWDGGCTGNTCELINVTIGENIPEDTCVDEGDYISVNATYMGTCPDKVYVTVNTTNLYCPIGYE